MANVTVLGAGAWGTAFGQVLADAGNNVTMWAIEPEIVEGIRDHHHNGVRLPSVETLPSNMTATGDRAEAVANADIVIVAIAAQFARVALTEFKGLIPETALVASLMKGIERTTGKRMDEVVMETLDLPAERFAAISGPNLSRQIADREPAATVVGCADIDNARKIATACTTDYFRAFVTRDVIGLEMCGSLKNVVALAVGMARGAGYGENTDTHKGMVHDSRELYEFYNRDFVPFSAGINAVQDKTPAVMVGHTIYDNIDPDYPASLSPAIHEVLRDKLEFDGVAITDDMGMDAIKEYAGDGSVYVKAILADNDMICVTDYETAYNDLKAAYESGELSDDIIDSHVRRILMMKLGYGIIK